MRLVLLVFFVVLVSSCSKSDDNKPSKITYSIKNHIRGSVKSITIRTYKAVAKFGILTKGDPSEDGRSGEYGTLVSFDENSNKTSERYYNSDGILSGESIYAYDNKSNVISEKQYNSDGSIRSEYTYQYDSKSKLISRIESYYYNNGKPSGKYTYRYTYDSKLNTKTEIYGDGTYSGEKCIYTYDENSNEISRHDYDSFGTVREKSTYAYDDKLNMISEIDYYYKVLERNYTYVYKQYDKNDNWTERIRYIDKTPLVITVRKIKYY